MARPTQGQSWSEVLCCPLCQQLFSALREPLSACCGHVLCRTCARTLPGSVCPIDQIDCCVSLRDLPSNTALLSIVGVQKETAQDVREFVQKHNNEEVPPLRVIQKAESSLIGMATYLRRAQSERGGSVWSEILSRTIQRKLVAVLCFQLIDEEARSKSAKTLRSLAERILSEQLLSQQMGNNVSTQLWTAVRARGCQFLGPAMQEDVLKLILLALGTGALIARKTLVMYVVQTLGDDYPQVSKTCVGHVVQLLYRASCFNVLKRDGDSSLMQLKEEFRTYDSLRREHDAQIVGMAVEGGLRISPDQWSALLYGDQAHRSHMQSVIDKLQSPQSYTQGIEELCAVVCKTSDPNLGASTKLLAEFSDIHPTHKENVSWDCIANLLEAMKLLLDEHSQFVAKRNERRNGEMNMRRQNTIPLPPSNNNLPPMMTPIGGGQMQQGGVGGPPRFKTRMCRETALGKLCPRGVVCTFAHSREELRMACARAPPGARPLPPRVQNYQGAPISQMLPMGPFTSPPPPAPGTVLIDPKVPPPIMNEMGLVPVVPVVPVGAPMPPDMAQLPAPPPTLITATPTGTQQVVMMPRGTSTTVMVAPGMAVWSPQSPPPQMMMQQHITWIPAGSNPHGGPPCFDMGGPAVPDGMMWGTVVPDHMHHHVQQPVHNGHFIPQHPNQQPLHPNHQQHPQQQQHHQLQFTHLQYGNGMRREEEEDYDDDDGKGMDMDAEEEKLFLRRAEIMTRLALSTDDEGEGEDTVGHVSYTVASSVLDDKGHIIDTAYMDFPPIPISYTMNCSSDGTLSMLGDLAAAIPRTRKGSLGAAAVTTTVRTVCPAPSTAQSTATRSATVQSDSSTMTVKDTVRQPLSTPAIQHTVHPSLHHHVHMVDKMPRVIQPLDTPQDAQNFVSKTLDRIVDVKERLTEGTVSSSVLSEQLRVELSIASRQMASLDPVTKQSCLLKELEEVDKKIEQIELANQGE